jgi:DNA-binding SARP family transcriptional activator
MKQAILSQKGNSLLAYALSRLSPDVFSHPVWTRFAEEQAVKSPNPAEDLLNAARNVQETDPGAACQMLLICAVYQNRTGQPFQAIKTSRQAISLAEQSKLAREMIWALWGACVIWIQQGNYEQATSNMVDLQEELSKQNEWILADFIDVLKHAFTQDGMIQNRREFTLLQRDASDDPITLFMDWLHDWGFLSKHLESEIGSIPTIPAPNRLMGLQPFFSTHNLQGDWRTWMLAIRSELNLQWVEHQTVPPKRQFSLWGSMLNSLWCSVSEQKFDGEAPDEVHLTPGMLIDPIPSITDHLSASSELSQRKPASRKAGGEIRQLAEHSTDLIPITVHMLGTFSVTVQDLKLKLPPSRGLAVLKYLLLHYKKKVGREVLMDVFWPDAAPETARNSLNVAMHSLRKALRTAIFLPVIVFQDGAYGLESNLQVWLDVEEFEKCVKTGQRLEARGHLTSAVSEYESAISLYQGDFLEQNLYDEWTVLERERLRIAYLDTLDRLSQIYFSHGHYAACITVCQLILAHDRCREDAHCLLMRCYSRQGQYHLARRQYQVCVDALRVELEVEPSPETKQLYKQIGQREPV